ncbi:MAG TPA: caspase family protein [Kofleriaceae bacterium]|nr:caspase family protein [Kofleriaceae bacterium]
MIIGIDQYADSSIRNLSCAGRDARTIASLLRDRIAPDERHVTLLLDEQATRANIMNAIGEDLARASGPADTAIIYFAGHGSPERAAPRDEDLPYLVAHDTDYERIYATGIDMAHDVKRWLQRLRVELAVVFLDACFSGAAGGRTFAGPVRLANQGRFRDEPISIKDLDLGAGRVIIAAANDDEVAIEFESLGHGVFTYHLLEALRQSPAGSPKIGVAALYEYVADAVHQATGTRQRPVFNGTNIRGALPLLGVPGSAAAPAATTTATPAP